MISTHQGQGADEQQLWRAFVDAEYAYLKFVEPQSMRDLAKDIEGLVLDVTDSLCRRLFGLADPYSTPSPASSPDGQDVTSKEQERKGGCNIEQRKAARAILREFHPDKNPTRASEAKEYYQMLLQHIDKQNFAPIEQVYKVLIEQGSEAAWLHVKRMHCQDHASAGDEWAIRKAELDLMKRSLWYAMLQSVCLDVFYTKGTLGVMLV